MRLKDLPGDALAGVVNAVVSVPSGMATAALAGVNPVYGLYATVVSPTVGSLVSSSHLLRAAQPPQTLIGIAASQSCCPQGFDSSVLVRDSSQLAVRR